MSSCIDIVPPLILVDYSDKPIGRFYLLATALATILAIMYRPISEIL